MTRPSLTTMPLLVLGLSLLILGPGLAQEKPASLPCTAEGYRQFDFWIGEWQVISPDGTEVGTNRIESILDGCVIQESWTGAQGSRGKSFNRFDSRTDRWSQVWVDNGGGILMLSGGLEESRMVLSGEREERDGRTAFHRITWSPEEEDKVRQHWEVSYDDGANWKDLFMGIYAKD